MYSVTFLLISKLLIIINYDPQVPFSIHTSNYDKDSCNDTEVFVSESRQSANFKRHENSPMLQQRPSFFICFLKS